MNSFSFIGIKAKFEGKEFYYFPALQEWSQTRGSIKTCSFGRSMLFDNVFHRCLCSTILAEEKAQQEERSRMEMRRQVPVSWDSGGSDEAPPKVSNCAELFLMLNKLTTNVLINVWNWLRMQKEHLKKKKFIGLFMCFLRFYIYGSLSSSGTADLLPRLTACHHLSP